MATNGTIRYSMNVSLSNGSLADSYNTSGLTATQVTGSIVRNVQTLQVASVQGDLLDFGGVAIAPASPGLAAFSNLDALNYVEIGIRVSQVFYPFMKLLAGQQAGPLFLGASVIYARDNTANVQLFYLAYSI